MGISNEQKIKSLVEGMYNDNIQYPQLKLPEMQEQRLKDLFELVQVPTMKKMNSDNEKLGQAIDRVESLAFGIKLPLPPALHMEGLQESLPDIVKQLKEGFIETTGENPWE